MKQIQKHEQNHKDNHRNASKTAVAVTAAVSAAAGIAGFYYFENNAIVTTSIPFHSPRVPAGFDGFRILHLSDLHDKVFGRDQSRLLRKMAALSPDLIVMTGDLINKRKPRMDRAVSFVREAAKIAPFYFTAGNHEEWSGIYPELSREISYAGARVLDDACAVLERDGDEIALIGMRDLNFLKRESRSLERRREIFAGRLSLLCDGFAGGFQILLSHKPEQAQLYARQGVDLVFCGHAHGGQVRLPHIGGLYAPEQGILPKYTSGIYSIGQTAMVVSRGLGASVIPMRVFNRPELVLVTLGRVDSQDNNQEE